MAAFLFALGQPDVLEKQQGDGKGGSGGPEEVGRKRRVMAGWFLEVLRKLAKSWGPSRPAGGDGRAAQQARKRGVMAAFFSALASGQEGDGNSGIHFFRGGIWQKG